MQGVRVVLVVLVLGGLCGGYGCGSESHPGSDGSGNIGNVGPGPDNYDECDATVDDGLNASGCPIGGDWWCWEYTSCTDEGTACVDECLGFPYGTDHLECSEGQWRYMNVEDDPCLGVGGTGGEGGNAGAPAAGGASGAGGAE